jgi:ABC-type glycerol-3-phosphate transport system permease component
MEISINTPALLFPAISLLLLAYTNRFLAIANLVRKLHDDFPRHENKANVLQQIISLRKRLNYIRLMQGTGVFSFLLCIICMYCIYEGWMFVAKFIFAASLISMLVSLLYSMVEIIQSTKALELELEDIKGLGDKDQSSVWNFWNERDPSKD